MDLLFLVLIVFIVLGFIFNKITNKAPSKAIIPDEKIVHKKQEYLTTENERKLFFALKKVFGDKYLIHCQTSLIALVDPIEFKYKSKAWSKRMDYVITDTATKVVCIIELDDSSHNHPKRIARDKYVNSALDGHHPLIRIKTQKFYNPEALIKVFEENLNITIV